ncbi:MAG: LytTR family transcriptional regulator [bacterium]|nr:LytTR family transcriptional regulator [bacterium]
MVELYLSKRNKEQALAITESLDATSSLEKNVIQIESESKKEETLILDLDQFLFAMADNNYTTIYFMKDAVLRKHLLRVKIKNLQDQLSKYPSILRTHKSFLVNKQKIVSLEGNARSLNIILDGYNGKLPVSRSISRELLVS